MGIETCCPSAHEGYRSMRCGPDGETTESRNLLMALNCTKDCLDYVERKRGAYVVLYCAMRLHATDYQLTGGQRMEGLWNQ